MLITVNYVKTIDNRMKVFKLVSDVQDEELGYVCSYQSQDTDFNSNSYFIVNGKLRGLYYVKENSTLQECLESLKRITTFFYNDVELIFNGESIKEDCPEDNIDSSILERLPFDQN